MVFDIKRYKNNCYITELIQKNYPFEFVKDDVGKLRIKLSIIEENKNKYQKEEIYYPLELITLTFKHIKKISENYLKIKNQKLVPKMK